MKCFNCGEIGHLICACPNRTNENRPVVDDSAGGVGELAEAGPSNAASPGTVSKGVTAQATNSKAAVKESTSTNADGLIFKSVVQKDLLRDGSVVNVLQSNLSLDGVDTEAEQSQFKEHGDGENRKSVDVGGVEGEESMVVVSGGVESTENENENETNVSTDTVVAVAECILAEENKNTEFEKDEALFKAPASKRKRVRKSPRKTTDVMLMDQQADKSEETDYSALDDSDSEAVDSNNGKGQQSYSFAKVRSFLQKKNMKNVHVVDYFQDRKAFIESDVVMLMRGEGEEQFTIQEIYRLKEFVSKVKLELKNEDGFETT
ncbi:Branchpoint-bridging protein [Labeo rohita]|uniref:Branchpoint-bridging protein n=1 Tax=Labeo rohita TaxID=84645 RepID=A0ABQ8LVM4_LABRO|nr:Branchpoint-bridging protein [Labeo rohita]